MNDQTTKHDSVVDEVIDKNIPMEDAIAEVNLYGKYLNLQNAIRHLSETVIKLSHIQNIMRHNMVKNKMTSSEEMKLSNYIDDAYGGVIESMADVSGYFSKEIRKEREKNQTAKLRLVNNKSNDKKTA